MCKSWSDLSTVIKGFFNVGFLQTILNNRAQIASFKHILDQQNVHRNTS
jgi:hypothetical protein